jgi:phage baseplate assembly protein gpV
MSFHTVNDTVNFAHDYSSGYHTGTVVANDDPLGLGRIQVNVPGLYDSAKGEVPWVGPHDRQSPFGYGTSAEGPYGVYGVPPVGATVKVELQDGDVHKPLYSAYHTKKDANSKFMTASQWGYQDPDGNVMVYDLAAHTYLFTTRSGASIEIDGTGKRITAINGEQVTSHGNWSIGVTGNASIVATGSATVQGQSVNVTAQGTATYTAASHVFHGPITADSNISAAGDITDSTGTGNAETMASMRSIFNSHRHHYDDNGNDGVTDVPFPLT